MTYVAGLDREMREDPPPASDAWPQEWHPYRWREYEETRESREAIYHTWCSFTGLDPEDVVAMAAFERAMVLTTDDPDYWRAVGYA